VRVRVRQASSNSSSVRDGKWGVIEAESKIWPREMDSQWFDTATVLVA